MSGFLKTHVDAFGASEARRRSVALRAGGVATPAAWAGPSDREVRFERVAGETGVALAGGDLAGLLSVVSDLHRTQVPGLKPYDPFLRLRPRLALATRLRPLDVMSEPVPGGSATLHGDLHVGQFIRDLGGKVWLVDLDDLALGPPEADLANLAAHLATTIGATGIAHWSRRIGAAWQSLGHRLDEDVFTRFLRFSLVRRHLKLREAGRPDFEAEILI